MQPTRVQSSASLIAPWAPQEWFLRVRSKPWALSGVPPHKINEKERCECEMTCPWFAHGRSDMFYIILGLFLTLHIIPPPCFYLCPSGSLIVHFSKVIPCTKLFGCQLLCSEQFNIKSPEVPCAWLICTTLVLSLQLLDPVSLFWFWYHFLEYPFSCLHSITLVHTGRCIKSISEILHQNAPLLVSWGCSPSHSLYKEKQLNGNTGVWILDCESLVYGYRMSGLFHRLLFLGFILGDILGT